MLSNPSQYSPQSLLPQFFATQAGLPQTSPGLFGQPGVYNGNAQFANGQFGIESAMNPYLWQSSLAGHPGAHIPVQQIAPVLGQLAQHIAIQSAVAQQIGAAVHQLAHQLALQGLQGYPAGGFGTGLPFTGPGQPYIGGAQVGGVQAYGQPFGLGAGVYGGLNPQAQGWGPQAQAWGANRPQTIQ
jgi:hypothetical protein